MRAASDPARARQNTRLRLRDAGVATRAAGTNAATSPVSAEALTAVARAAASAAAATSAGPSPAPRSSGLANSLRAATLPEAGPGQTHPAGSTDHRRAGQTQSPRTPGNGGHTR
jgi:hypothetical protein